MTDENLYAGGSIEFPCITFDNIAKWNGDASVSAFEELTKATNKACYSANKFKRAAHAAMIRARRVKARRQKRKLDRPLATKGKRK